MNTKPKLSEDDRIVLRVLMRGPGAIFVPKAHLLDAGLIEHQIGPLYQLTKSGKRAYSELPKELQ